MSGQYLNEEKYLKQARRLNAVSIIMIILGAVGFIGGGILLFGNYVPFQRMGLVGFGWVLSGALAGFGLVLHMHANRRRITAYMMQSQIPVAKEAVKEMTPAAAEAAKEMLEEVSPALGDAAKKVAEGIREGMKE